VLPLFVAAGGALAAPERLLERVRGPEYPEAAIRDGVGGDVSCDLTVSVDGGVTSVLCDAPSAPLADAARSAAAGFRFAPAAQTEKLRVSFRFELEATAPVDLAPVPYGRVRLEVVEAGTRAPVQGASVVVVGFGVGGATNGKGVVNLRLPSGELFLLVTAPEYTFAQVQLEIGPASEASHRVYLYRSRPPEFATTIVGERRRDAPARTQLQHEELRNVPGTGEDPIRVVELLPGVARAPFSGGQLVVRGARPTDTGAYLNGQRIPILYHLLNGPSVIGEATVESIEFLAGGAGVFYGGQLAGVVAVTPRFGDPETLHGSAAADFAKSAAWLEGPFGSRTQFGAGGRISYVNPIQSASADPERPFSVPVYADYQSSLRHRFDSGSVLSVLLFGSRDSFANVGLGRGLTIAERDRQLQFHRAQVSLVTPLSPSLTLTLSPTAGYDDSNDSSQATGEVPETLNTTTFAFGLRSELAFRPSPALELRAGTDWTHTRVGYDFDQRFDQRLPDFGIPNGARELGRGVRHIADYGQYVQAEVTLGRLRVTPGVRLDVMHWQGHTYAVTDPRVWMRYAVTPSLDAFAYAGLYHEAPQALELDPATGNPALLPSWAQQYGVGGEARFGSSWIVRLEGFYQRRGSLVFSAEARTDADGTVKNPLFLNSGIARSYGAELLLRKQLSSTLYGWVAYTLSRTEELQRAGEQWQPGPFDQTHVLSLLLGLRPSTQVEFSVRLRVATGNPEKQVVDAVFDNTTGRYVPVTQPLGSTRLPWFAQLDFQINNIWTADVFRLGLYAELENLLDRRNGEVLVYDYRYTQPDTVQSVPFNATAGVKVQF
jgi:TonB-dependent Receptor Plug Domain/Gram-negative bacterial TonB protein C-terminal